MLAVNLPLLTMLRVVGGCVVGSLIRATYFLLTKQLDLSASYAFSVLALFAHPIRLIRGRSRRAAGMAEGYTAVRLFIPPARTFSRLAEKIAGLIGSGPPQATYGRHQATVEESEEDEQFVDQQSVLRRVIAHPGVSCSSRCWSSPSWPNGGCSAVTRSAAARWCPPGAARPHCGMSTWPGSTR